MAIQKSWPRALELRQIHFSQNTIKHAYQDGRPLEDVEHDLRTGRLDHPPGKLQVVFCDGKWYTRSNRTLYVLKRAFPAEMVVPVIAGPVDRVCIQHFTAKCGGVWVKVRGRHNLGSSVPTATRRRPEYHHWSRKKRSAAKTVKEAGRPGFQPGHF